MMRMYVALAAISLAIGCDANLRKLQLVDSTTGGFVGSSEDVATGLDTYLVARITGLHYSPPDDLIILADDPAAIALENLGPVGFESNGTSPIDPSSDEAEGTLIRLRALRDGRHRLRFLANQTDETETLELFAHAPTEVHFERAWRATDDLDARLATFGRRVDVTVTVYSGSMPLNARGPLVVSSPEPATVISGSPAATPWLLLAEATHTTIVTVPGVDGSLSVTAATADDIADIAVRVGASDVDAAPVSATAGDRLSIQLTPLLSDHLAVNGTAPVDFEADIEGESVSVASRLGTSLILEATQPGPSTLHLLWATATRDVDIDVTP